MAEYAARVSSVKPDWRSRSSPAQKTSSPPVTMTAATSWSVFQTSRRSANSPNSSGLRALRRSGRVNVMVPTPSVTAAAIRALGMDSPSSGYRADWVSRVSGFGKAGRGPAGVAVHQQPLGPGQRTGQRPVLALGPFQDVLVDDPLGHPAHDLGRDGDVDVVVQLSGIPGRFEAGPHAGGEGVDATPVGLSDGRLVARRFGHRLQHREVPPVEGDELLEGHGKAVGPVAVVAGEPAE